MQQHVAHEDACALCITVCLRQQFVGRQAALGYHARNARIEGSRVKCPQCPCPLADHPHAVFRRFGAAEYVIHAPHHVGDPHAEQRLVHVPRDVGHRRFDVEQMREIVATLAGLRVRRLCFTDAANHHGDDQFTLPGEFFVQAELESIRLLASFVDIQRRWGWRGEFIGQKDPSGYVDIGLGEKIDLVDTICLSLRCHDQARRERAVALGNTEDVADFGRCGNLCCRRRQMLLVAFQNRKDRVATAGVAQRSVRCAVQGFRLFELEVRFRRRTWMSEEPAAEPIGRRDAQLHRPRMRVGSLLRLRISAEL